MSGNEASLTNINDRLKMNLARLQNSIIDQSKILSANEGNHTTGLENFNEHFDMGNGDFEFGLENEGPYGNSMFKMIDEADRLLYGREMMEDYFLNGTGIMNEGPLNLNFEFKITPGKIRDIEENYFAEMNATTRKKKNIRSLEEKLEENIMNNKEMNIFEFTYETILEFNQDKESWERQANGDKDQNDDFQELWRNIEGSRIDPDFKRRIIDIGLQYKEAIEIGRLDARNENQSRRNLDLNTTSNGKILEEGHFETGQEYADNYQLDNQNLDNVFEVINGNFTKGNYLNSYEVWSKLTTTRNLTRRLEHNSNPQKSCPGYFDISS